MDSIQVESQYSSELNRFVGLNYENALSKSLHAVLDSLQNPNFENFSKFTSDFREIVQFKINPPFEAIWVYTALAFRSFNSTKDEPLEKLSTIKDLFQLITTYSASCTSLQCILLIAPVIYNLHKLVLGFKNFELSSKKEKKFFREIKDFSDSVLGYTSVCSDGLYGYSHKLDDDLIRPLKDMVGLWVWDEKVQSDTDKGRLKKFFPLLGEDIVEEISSAECGFYEMSGHVIAEAFLLKLCLAFSGKSSGKELQIELRNWAVGAITGHRNSYFFDSLLRMLFDPPLPLSSLLIPEYEMLLRNVLYDSVILVEYHFLNPERLTHLPTKHAKSLALGRLIVTHEAIELLREQEDQTKALSYTNAFSSSTLPSYLIKWIRNEIGGEFDSNGPNGSSPKAFIRWILNIENRGVNIFDVYMSKYRAKLVADNTEEDLKLLAYNEKTKDLDIDIPFYIDNKGEEEGENVKDEKMSAAFVAAAHSLQSGEEPGGKKRKAENNKKKRVPKFIKYNLCEDSILSGERSSLASNDDSSSGGEVNNPSSDEE